ncbi:MAG: glycosyltransferase family 39 protein [Candidatus Dadabacteria bacterium]|nr:glycosyltransferase family 39 protein [Candidatus Dadabacteria bacterium]
MREQVDRFPSGFKVLVIVLLIIGIFLRLYDIDGKFFWGDEVNTLLYTAGFTKQELISEIVDKEIEIGYLNKFIFTNPEKSFIDIIKAISVDETQHPPLYYLLSSIWLKVFGDSIWVIRSFSVLMGLLVFPCIYWLCRELFESRKVAWLVVAIVAVSPFHLIYAQEARLYSMWTVTVLLSSALLLRALSRKSKFLWALYAISILVGIYTFTLFALVIAAHGAYVLIITLPKVKFQPIKLPGKLISYGLSTLAALILFIPWAYILLKNLSKARGNLVWMDFDIGLPALVKLWGFNLNSPFLDIGLVPKISLPMELPVTSVEFMNSPHLDQILGSYPFIAPAYFSIKILVLILILYSIYFVLKHSQKRSSIFITSLIVIPFLGVTMKDFIFGGVGSTIVGYRFFVPVIIGIEVSVAYLLTAKISKAKDLTRRTWQGVTIFILICGLVSCITYIRADSWWTLRYGYHIKRIAPIINSANNPVIITKFESQILAFPHHIDPEVKLITIENLENFKVPQNTDDIFVYDLTPDLREKLDNLGSVRIEEINEDDRLWRLIKVQ